MSIVNSMENEAKSIYSEYRSEKNRENKKDLKGKFFLKKQELNKYIINNYLNNVNTEREIKYKESYCLGFIMNNMNGFEEFRNGFSDYYAVSKLANKYFINDTKIYNKKYLKDAKKQKVYPNVGDIIIIRRSDDSHHAVTYIGNGETVSANSSDHNGGSEIKKVKYSNWKYSKGVKNLYVFDTKGFIKDYWKSIYDNSNISKIEFLDMLYNDRIAPDEITYIKAVEENNIKYENGIEEEVGEEEVTEVKKSNKLPINNARLLLAKNRNEKI